MRPLWKHFLDDISFVLFLIDLNDEDRLAEAAEELALFYRMVKNKEHDSSHFFIIFTKEDLLPKPNREKAIANATSRIKTSLQPHLVDTLPLHFLNTPNLNLRTATNLNPALSHIKTLLSPSPPHPPPSFINPSSHPPTPLPPSHTDLLSLIHTHNSTAEPSDAIFWDGFLTAKLPAWDHYAHLRAGYLVLLRQRERGGGVREAVEEFMGHLERLRGVEPERFGKTGHWTMTGFWMGRLEVAREKGEGKEYAGGRGEKGLGEKEYGVEREEEEEEWVGRKPFREVLVGSPELMEGGLWKEYYSREVMFSSEARSGWREPDLKGLGVEVGRGGEGLVFGGSEKSAIVN